MSDKLYTSYEIKNRLEPVFRSNGVRQAILFGSYSKGNATPTSDVDLLVDSGLKGLQFVGLIEAVREALDKEIDMFDVRHIEADSLIDHEIKATGQVIYEK